jgi:hypothetical protein
LDARLTFRDVLAREDVAEIHLPPFEPNPAALRDSERRVVERVARRGTFQVFRNGGTKPAWRGDGREIFFLAPDGTMMAAATNTANGFAAGIPESLFATGALLTTSRHQYAVTKDGQQFLINAALQPVLFHCSAEPTITLRDRNS